ncbi:Bax inhibitor-1/YccA family protein [Candidatus Liberibacter americanus]|uniref:Integral membrane protein n=1 Tax=Candidatus Liberibacter americanus str. Sao Paulo TaxID=1261131 RepID=U6B6U0_9HYPH|nr:Bax inhibitor-1/YccA family protein [Candidatus Liberibacter americanus]AHA27462.1 Integral membrane protein [Candidatus Liberibacter americanus str. Sao Paulo]EMS36577.1 hypothetical protein G653_01432 [Candidatus Liberibacter americanus PW_SP]
MSNLHDYQDKIVNSRGKVDSSIDEGLRSYMIGVYNLMSFGIFITAIVSFLTNNFATTLDPYYASATTMNGIMLTSFGSLIYFSPLKYVIIFAPLVLLFFMQYRVQYLSLYALRMIFFTFSALFGLSLSSIFLVYTNQSIVQTLFITAAAFGSLSLYGYSTKKDLGPMATFCVMGLFGVILASIVNLFIGSNVLDMSISLISIIIFSGLTAYDTQKIKETYSDRYCADTLGRSSIFGALELYIDFISIFTHLLRLTGSRKD